MMLWSKKVKFENFLSYRNNGIELKLYKLICSGKSYLASTWFNECHNALIINNFNKSDISNEVS